MINPEDVEVDSISKDMQFPAAAFLDHALKEPKICAALARELIESGLVSPLVTNWERIYKAALNDLYEDYVEDQEAKGNRPAPLQLWIDAAQLRLGKTDTP
jgi:hypothetical protein